MLKRSLLPILLLALPLGAEVLETPPTEQVARGEYLAKHVAMCVQCHSPHSRNGDLQQSRLFEGQAIPVKGPYPDADNWAFNAPALKQLPGWTVEEFVHLLTKGSRISGQKPKSPMPPFRMSKQDAEAIAAYLKSL